MKPVEYFASSSIAEASEILCANDVGREINLMAIEGPIEGGAQLGPGYALTEEVIVKDGRVLGPNFNERMTR